jgi:YidC/Oxa1 family membrane protein insertase
VAVIEPVLAADAWTMVSSLGGDARVLTFESSAGMVLTWRIPREGYLLQLEVNGAPAPVELTLRSGSDFRPSPSAGFGNWLEQIHYAALDGRVADFDADRAALDEEVAPEWQTDGWAGFRSRYWAAMVRAEQAATFQPHADPAQIDAAVDIRIGNQPGRLSIYLGPIEPAALAEADPSLRGLLYGALWFWLRWICFGLAWFIGVIHAGVSAVVPAKFAWGVSIMLLSLTVHILMRPLSRIADRFQDQVHATESRLAPELGRIKKEYKGEQQSEQILALYKSEGVHPLYSLKSLLGVAVVIPIFIGAFDMLAENIHLLGTGFFWIADLSRPDAIAPLPFTLPFLGSALNLLPFLMTGLSVLASWLHRPAAQHPSLRKKQVRNMLLLAAAFFVLFYTFPAGMVLYWTTNNLISAVKGGWQHRRGPPPA